MTAPEESEQGAEGPRPGRWLLYLEALSYLCTSLALIGLFLQISADSSAQRSEMSLKHVEQFNTEPVNTHRLNLSRAWMPWREELATINDAGGGYPNDIADFVNGRIDPYNPANQSILISIYELTAFYDRTLLCVEVGACDKRIVDAYFETIIREFWGLYRHIIVASRRYQSKNLGKVMEAYIAKKVEG